MTDIKWPEGAEAKIDDDFAKWVNGVEYNLDDGEWVKNQNSWSLVKFKSSDDFKVIERPIDASYVPKVGDRCENANPEVAAYYGKLSYIGLSRGGSMIMEGEGSNLLRFSAGTVFRPIKTELDQFIEKALIATGQTINTISPDFINDIFGAMHKDGFKAPE